MTPSEQQTLDLILRDVEKFTGLCNRAPIVRRIVTLDNHRFAVDRGDYLIDRLELLPTGAQCA